MKSNVLAFGCALLIALHAATGLADERSMQSQEASDAERRADHTPDTSGESDANGTTPSAEELLRAALNAYDSSDLNSAKRLFEEVHKMAPSARTLRSLGIVAYQEGRYVAAVTFFEQSLVHHVKPLTVELETGVRELLDQARSRVGRVRVGGLPEGTVLELDGAPVVEDAQGALLMSPGEHELHASSGGLLEGRERFAIAGGQTIELTVLLKPTVREPERVESAPGRNDPPAVANKATAKTPATHSRRRLRALAYVSAALSVAALGTATGATGTALHRVSVIENACKKSAEGTCDAEFVRARERDASLSMLSRLATATAISATALGAASVVLFVRTSPSRGTPEQSAVLVSVHGTF